VASGAPYDMYHTRKDNSVRLWDVATGTPIGEPLFGHASPAEHLAFSADSKLIVVKYMHAIVAWDVDTGRRVEVPNPRSSKRKNDFVAWRIDADGWVRDTTEKRVFWVPPDLRPVDHGEVVLDGDRLAVAGGRFSLYDVSAYVSD
jgi:WD40 repeat protein